MNDRDAQAHMVPSGEAAVISNADIAGCAQRIKACNSAVIVSHIAPDGDTLGSAAALMLSLRAMGKRAVWACADTLPYAYAFMPFSGEILPIEEAGDADMYIAVDCATLERMGDAAQYFQNAPNKINLDHHYTNERFGDLVYVDQYASSTGEIILELIETLGVPLSEDMARCLYIAISTDTGNFCYANTTAKTFRAAAKMLDAGVNVDLLSRMIYNTRSFAKTKLIGAGIDHMELYCDGRIAIMALTLEQILDTHSAELDTEGLVDYARDVDSVEIAAFLRETASGTIKVSLRAKLDADVGAIAETYAGGGHKRAAGCTLHMDLSSAVQEMLRQMERALPQTL